MPLTSSIQSDEEGMTHSKTQPNYATLPMVWCKLKNDLLSVSLGNGGLL